MRPLFEEAKVPLDVRTAGQGGGCGDDYKNQPMCLRNLAGDDTDVWHDVILFDLTHACV